MDQPQTPKHSDSVRPAGEPRSADAAPLADSAAAADAGRLADEQRRLPAHLRPSSSAVSGTSSDWTASGPSPRSSSDSASSFSSTSWATSWPPSGATSTCRRSASASGRPCPAVASSAARPPTRSACCRWAATSTWSAKGRRPTRTKTIRAPSRTRRVGQRMLIISAGVIMNVLLGCILFIVVYNYSRRRAGARHRRPGRCRLADVGEGRCRRLGHHRTERHPQSHLQEPSLRGHSLRAGPEDPLHVPDVRAGR